MGKRGPAKGTPSPSRGKGAGIAWLRAHVHHTDDGCLLWPFNINPKGYGILGWNGQMWRAHRLMCTLSKGPPPTEEHHAAHSCGNRACVNPKHLSWKTSTENHLDQREHGTSITSRYGRNGALEPLQVKMILALKGVATQAAIAEQFDVSEETIRRIHNGVSYAKSVA